MHKGKLQFIGVNELYMTSVLFAMEWLCKTIGASS